jgi:glycosyltransferase involved in cell wall biosynthesis
VKLLVLCERVDNEGGTETYLRVLLPALAARGYEIVVAARTVGRTASYGVPDYEVPWSDEHDPPSRDAANRIAEIVTAFEPDVVAAHNVMDAGVLKAARFQTRRFVYHLHDHRPFCPNGDRLYPRSSDICGLTMSAIVCGWHSAIDGCAYGPRPRTMQLIGLRETLAAGVREADSVIALSEYVAGLARRNGVANVRVVTPPISADAFASAPAPRPEADAVLFAGRIVPSKGGRSLVRAIARISAERRPLLRVAGDGPDLDALLLLAKRLGVRTEPLGRLEPNRLRGAIDASTLVAVPSLWGEPFGLAGIEAFARGRPVAAYDSGAIGEWLDPAAGTIVARGDEVALAIAVERLCEPAVWPNRAVGALAAAQRYALEPHVEAIAREYEIA